MSDGVGSTELFLALQRIQARVEERTRSGAYPLGLDTQLRVRFTELVEEGQQMAAASSALEHALHQLIAHPSFDRSQIALTSRLPGGSTVHNAVGKAVSRQTAGVLQQLQEYRLHLEHVVRVVVDAYITAAAERDMNYRIALDRLAEVEDLSARYRAIEARLARLEDNAVGGAQQPTS